MTMSCVCCVCNMYVLCMCIHVCMHVYVCAYVCVCTYVYVLCMYVHVCMRCMYICICMYIHLVCMYMYVYMYVYTYRPYIYLHVHVCTYMYVCMYMYVRIDPTPYTLHPSWHWRTARDDAIIMEFPDACVACGSQVADIEGSTADRRNARKLAPHPNWAPPNSWALDTQFTRQTPNW